MGEKGGDMGKYRVREMRDGRGVAYFLPQRRGWLFWHTLAYHSDILCNTLLRVCFTLECAYAACEEDARRRAPAVVVKDHDVLV